MSTYRFPLRGKIGRGKIGGARSASFAGCAKRPQ